MFQVRHKAFVHHILHNLTRCVERTGLFAGGGLSLWVIRSQKIFKHFSEELGVKRHFLLQRGVLLNGKIVMTQDVNNALCTDLFLLGIPIPLGKVDVTPHIFSKEQVIRHDELTRNAFAVGERINVYAVVLVIQAVEKSSIQERDFFVGQFHKEVRIDEQILISHQLVIVIIAPPVAETALRNGVFPLGRDRTVEHGKEEILQYTLVVMALFRFAKQRDPCIGGETFYKVLGNEFLIKKLLGDKMPLLEEPYKDKPCDQANHRLGIILLVVSF